MRVSLIFICLMIFVLQIGTTQKKIEETYWESAFTHARVVILKSQLEALKSIPPPNDFKVGDFKGKLKQLAKENPTVESFSKAITELDLIIQPLLDKIDELRAAITNDGGMYLYQGECYSKSLEERKAIRQAQGITNFVLTEEVRLDGKPVNKRDKDITTRILVEEGRGEELKLLLNQTEQALKNKIDEIIKIPVEDWRPKKEEIEALKADLRLKPIDDQVYLNDGKESWSEYAFKYMPVAGCYPLFRKYQNDAEHSVQQIAAYIYRQLKKQKQRAAIKADPNLEALVKRLDALEETIALLLQKIDTLRAAITNEGGLYLYQGTYHEKSFEARKTQYESQGFNHFVLTDDRRLEGKPVDKKNKEITTKVLVEDGGGEELKALINQTREDLENKIDELMASSAGSIPLDSIKVQQLKKDLILERLDEEIHLEYGKASWSEHVFGYMPVAACYPLFRMYQNNAKNSVDQIQFFFKEAAGLD